MRAARSIFLGISSWPFVPTIADCQPTQNAEDASASSLPYLFNSFRPDRKFLNASLINLKPNSRPIRSFDGSLGADRHRRLDNIFMPVTRAGGNVAGQSKSGESGHGDVVRAANSRFEHAAAPDGNSLPSRNGFDAFRLTVTADSAQLQIYYAASAEANCMLSISSCLYRLVQTHSSRDLFLLL